MYLVSNKQNKIYKDSRNKIQEYYNFKSEIVTILNGDIVEYKGIKFGGCMSWYDGRYGYHPSMYGTIPLEDWKRTMNDSRLIKGYKDFYEIFSEEVPKIESVLSADVIITHVCPLSEKIAFQPEYANHSSNKFYCFDGEKYLKQTNAKFWIHGHQHFNRRDLHVYDTELCINALGYPHENYNIQKMTIEI